MGILFINENLGKDCGLTEQFTATREPEMVAIAAIYRDSMVQVSDPEGSQWIP